MTAALLILAVTCIFMGGLLLHVAIRCNKLIDENRSFKATIRTLSTENESLKKLSPQIEGLKSTNDALQRTLESYSKSIEELKETNSNFRTLEQNYDSMYDENKELKVENDTLKQRNEGLEARIEEADKKLIALAGEYETKIATLKLEIEGLNSREICPYERMGGNRIVYCMKEKK